MNMDSLVVMKQKLLKKQHQDIDVQDPETLSDLERFINSLDSIPQNFPILKQLFISFGLPIMIDLRIFYQKLTSQICQDYQADLQALASIAFEMIERCEITLIDEIKFIFKWGRTQKKYKSVKKTDQQKQFIEVIKQLSQLKAKMRIKKAGRDELEEFITKNQNKYGQNLFLLHYFQKYAAYQLNGDSDFSISFKSQDSLNQNSMQNYDEDEEMTEKENQFDKSTFLSQNNGKTLFYEEEESTIQIIPEEMKKLSILQETKDFLCCRRFFYQNEEIKEYENEGLAFLNCKFPFNNKAKKEIVENICSMLNADGGIILIGINKTNGRRIVEGWQYTESEKQNVLRAFRVMAQTIEPDIITHKIYAVDFVPIRQTNESFVPGAYIIKVIVKYGIRDEIYSYQQDKRDYFPFRNHHEIIYKEGRILLKLLKQRIKNTPPIPVALHEGPCRKPELGEQIHDGFQPVFTKNERASISYKSKQFWPTSNEPVKREISPITWKKEKDNVSETFDTVKSQERKKAITSCSSQRPRNMQSCSAEAYFFVVGINEKQISPILEKKNILDEVVIESSKQSQLVIKAFSLNVIDKLRKIFERIEEKYAAKKIKIHQITLEIEVSEINEAHKFLSSMMNKCSFKKNNRVEFKLIRDSLQAFLLLENEMKVRFVPKFL